MTIRNMPEVNNLISQLASPETHKRVTSALIDLGEPAVGEIVAEMNASKDQATKMKLAFVLGKIGSKTSAEALFDVAKDSPDRSAFHAVQALRRIGAIDRLIALFDVSAGPIREVVVEQLGMVKDPRSIAALLVAAKDADVRVRASAGYALDRLNAFRDFVDLETLLADPSPWVWQPAIRVGFRLARTQTLAWIAAQLFNGEAGKQATLLSWLSIKYADPALFEPVTSFLKHDDPTLRLAAVRYLCFDPHSRAGALNILLNALEDEDWNVRRHALMGLKRLAYPAVLPNVLELLTDSNPHVRASAADLVGTIKEPSAVTALGDRLSDETDANVRDHLMQALVDIGTAPAVLIVLQAPAISKNNRYFICQKLAQKWPQYILEAAPRLATSRDNKCRATTARLLGLIGGREAASILARLIADEDADVYGEAVEALAKVGTPEAHGLIRGELERGRIEPWSRSAIFAEYGRRKDTSLIDKTSEALRDENEWVHDRAADVLGRFRQADTVGPLIELMLDPSKKRRFRAAEALGRMRAAQAIPALISALHADIDRDIQLANKAAWALGELGAGQAIPDLIEALHLANNNDDAMLIAFTSEALGKLRAAAAAEELLVTLKSDTVTGRHAAAWALGKIGDARAVEPLLQLLENPDQTYRLTALKSLGQIGGEVASAALLGVLQNAGDDGWMTALKGMATCAHPPAIPLLVELLQNPAMKISKLAGKALARTGKQAVEPLVSLFQHMPDPVVRRRVVWIWGEIGGDSAVKALALAMHDPEWRVRYKAVQALGKIGSTAALRIAEKGLEDPVHKVRIPARVITERRRTP